MSKKREIIKFNEGALPDEKITQILGATLTCLATSNNYTDFKNCLIVQPESEPTVMDQVGETVESATEAVSNVTKSFHKRK